MADEVKTETQQTQEEKLLAGKYKTADELEKAYKEAEKAFHNKAQQLAETEKKLKELEERKPDAPQDDLADYEYVSRKQFLEAQKNLQETLTTQFRKQMSEMQGFVQASMELSKIKQSHPDIPDEEIKAIINEYPEETDFAEALKKRKEKIAKVYGLHTTPPKTEKQPPSMPGQLQGVEQFGRESEDRSRIERMKKAGQSGNMSSILKKR